MLSLLVRKELLDQIRSLRFTVACLICPLLVLSSIWLREFPLSVFSLRLDHAERSPARHY